MKAVILTKSRMNSHGVSGVCTTAYDLESERILRFVSNQEGAPIGNPHNSRYECLDVVDVNILKDCPIGPQTENVLVDQTSFKKIGKYTGDLSELFDEIYNIYCFDRQYMFDIPEVFSYKRRLTDVATAEQLLRIIQSIPSKKAEPFKMWLAQVGRERIEETIDPELTIERALETYLKKGYSRGWINQRLRSLSTARRIRTSWLMSAEPIA